MREFNTFGPVNPRDHYHVNRVAVKAAIRQKIDKGRYFTLNAARQTGKTTLFREVMADLEAQGDYFGLLLSFETLRGHNTAKFYHWLHQNIIDAWQQSYPTDRETLTWLQQHLLQEHNSFGRLLRELGQRFTKRAVLMIDEFDAIGGELAEPMLAVFRDTYLNRAYHPDDYPLQSVVLVGVRNIPALLGGSQSPFNIADQYEVPYFTSDEVTDLFSQHTAETGQPITDEVLQTIYHETEGQPFLVNRIGQLLTQLAPDTTRPVTTDDLKQALSDLLAENNTHFASITAKAEPHRSTLLPILFYNQQRSQFHDPTTQTLLMYGILRRVRQSSGWIARLANPIYRKRLILTFTPPHNGESINGEIRHRYLVEGVLHFEGLLERFQQMMREHGITLLRSKRTDRPLEIGGQYLLLSYLTAALDTIGGRVVLEALNSAGEMDLVVFYQQQQFIIETKIYYSATRFQTGQQQLLTYLSAADEAKGYIVLFSQQPVDEAAVEFDYHAQGRQILTYLVMI